MYQIGFGGKLEFAQFSQNSYCFLPDQWWSKRCTELWEIVVQLCLPSSMSHNVITFGLSRSFSYVLTVWSECLTIFPNHFKQKLSEILTFLSEFNNANCRISDSIVRFLPSDQNVPDQANYYHENGFSWNLQKLA